MDAPQESADLAILPEDVASSLSCGNLALWRDKDYVLTCSDRDIDTDLFCPGDFTSPLHPGFPLLGNYFFPIVDLIPPPFCGTGLSISTEFLLTEEEKSSFFCNTAYV